MRIIAAALVSMSAAALPASAQRSVSFLPVWPVALSRLADANEPRIGVAIVNTDLLRDPLARRTQSIPTPTQREQQAVISFGTTTGLFGFARDRVVLGLTAGVVSRFRIEQQDNDYFSSDFMVGFPVLVRLDPLALTIRPIHRSGHLGDELIIKSGVRRLEFDHEEVEVILSSQVKSVRPYFGGSRTLASSYPEDQGNLRLGFDGDVPVSGNAALIAGLDWQNIAISEWKDRTAAAAGIRIQRAGRSLMLLLRYSSGTTSVGELFADRERFWGLELLVKG